MKWIKNNKGLTLIEMIISMFVLCIITTPVLFSYMSSIRLNRNTKEEISNSSIMRIVKEDVVMSVKTEAELYLYGPDNSNTVKISDLNDNDTAAGIGVPEYDQTPFAFVTGYQYDVEKLEIPDAEGLNGDMERYAITLKNNQGSVLDKIIIDVCVGR